MALKLHNHKSLEMNIIQMSSDEILMYVMSYIRFECDVLTIFFVCFSLSLSVCLCFTFSVSLSVIHFTPSNSKKYAFKWNENRHHHHHRWLFSSNMERMKKRAVSSETCYCLIFIQFEGYIDTLESLLVCSTLISTVLHVLMQSKW